MPGDALFLFVRDGGVEKLLFVLSQILLPLQLQQLKAYLNFFEGIPHEWLYFSLETRDYP